MVVAAVGGATTVAGAGAEGNASITGGGGAAVGV